MKKILTLLLIFTITLFLSGNQVVITQNYNFIVSNQSTFNFSTGALTFDNRYQRTNKIAITNDKVLADTLKYHYAFFWDEEDTYLGFYKTNRGVATSGSYLGEVNTQSIPLPLNAYSFALVRYDNDYILVGDYTIKDLFIDNNLDYENLPDFNEIPIPELNGLTLNQVFNTGNLLLNGTFDSDISNWTSLNSTSIWENGRLKNTGNGTSIVPRVSQNITITLNDQYYHRFDYEIFSTVINVASIANPSGQTFIATGLVFKASASVKITANSNNTSIAISHRYSTNADSLNKVLYLDNLYMINLTSLGLTFLTQAQLDRYFELYTNPINWIYYKTDGNLSSVNNYYYAAGKNLFDSVLEVGDILTADGTNVTISGRTRTQGFLKVKSLTTYVASFNSSTSAFMKYYEYDKNFNFIVSTSATNVTTKSNTAYLRFAINLADRINPQLEEGTNTAFEVYVAPTDLLNLTLLFGVGNEPNLATMNGYYAAYEEYLEYDFILPLTFANQTLSYELFYFDEGVSSEIEQLGSILIFTLIGFTLMIFGFTSRRRLFNLLSIGAFVVLGFLLIEFVGFIIILFGLIFINVYYTFFGEL